MKKSLTGSGEGRNARERQSWSRASNRFAVADEAEALPVKVHLQQWRPLL